MESSTNLHEITCLGKKKRKNNFKSKNKSTLSTDVYMLWSNFAVKVVVEALEAAKDDMVVVPPWLPEVEEALYEDGVSILSILLFFGSLILRSITSDIKPGFVILLSSTSISPVSILTTVDIVGLSLGVSWVQRRPIVRILQASSASKSPFNDMSTNPTNSLRS